ncbi:hypothetical protein ACVU7I_09705, partial [Patulibacter sp. S7RM1-6]
SERLGGREVAELLVDSLDELAAGRTDGSGTLTVARVDGAWSCRACGGDLGDGEDWTAAVERRTSVAAPRLRELGIRVRPNETVTLVELLCPHCGSLLDVRVVVAEA